MISRREIREIQRTASLSELMDSSPAKLTDAEWDTMPPLRTSKKKRYSVSNRDFINAGVVGQAHDIFPGSLLRAQGHPPYVRQVGAQLLRVNREVLEKHLAETRGRGYSLAPQYRSGITERDRLANVMSPLLLLDLTDPRSGAIALDDAQWSSIGSIFDDYAWFNHRRDARVMMNDYFRCIRQNLSAEHAGLGSRRRKFIAKLRKLGTLSEIAVRLLNAAGFAVPRTYRLPSVKDFDHQSDGHRLPPDRLRAELLKRFPNPRFPSVSDVALPTKTIACSSIVIDHLTLTVSTVGGTVIPLPARLVEVAAFMFENPRTILSNDMFTRAMVEKGYRCDPNSNPAAISRIRAAFREHAPEVADAIQTLRLQGSYYLDMDTVVEGRNLDR